MWTRPPFLRCQRDQDRVRHSAGAAGAEFSAELERGADRSPPIVRFNPKEGQRRLEMMRWGLIPYWAKDIKVGFATINAKAEGIDKKPAFGKAFSAGAAWCRSTIFTNGRRPRPGKQPYAIALKDRRPHGAGRLWETWRSPAGEWVRSFAIVTTTPNELCAELHNRMPAILAPEAWPSWLGEQPADEPQLKALLAPYPSDDMICWPVSARVGNVKNNDPTLIEPVAIA